MEGDGGTDSSWTAFSRWTGWISHSSTEISHVVRVKDRLLYDRLLYGRLLYDRLLYDRLLYDKRHALWMGGWM